MSILDSISDRGSDIAGGISDFGHDMFDGAKDLGSGLVSVAEIGGEAALGGLQFQADMTRRGLEMALDGGRLGLDLVSSGLDRVTHPGDPSPPAAEGLEFFETKGASQLAYDAKLGEKYTFQNGETWEVVDVLDDPATGFRGIALQSTDPLDDRTIVAFAGTREAADWKANIGQGLGLPTNQYSQAVEFANKWKSIEGENVVLTGHSLGGGLASYAAIKTGLHATAVNAAPLALNHLGINPVDWTHITQYYVPGEALSVLNAANLTDVRPGTRVPVRGGDSILDPRSIGSNHGLENVAPDVPLPTKTD